MRGPAWTAIIQDIDLTTNDLCEQGRAEDAQLGKFNGGFIVSGLIHGMSSPIGALVEIYADSPVMKNGHATTQTHRCSFFNPEPGVRLTHIANLEKVYVEVHHRDNTSRYTDFALVFQPLQLVSLSRGGKFEPYHGGPYIVRVEFKTSDNFVLFDVRVADRDGQVDTEAIPDPVESRQTRRRPSATQLLGGLLSSAVRRTERVAKGLRNFKELEEAEDEVDAFCVHDCVQVLKAWLTEQVAAPLQEIIRLEMQCHDGRGY